MSRFWYFWSLVSVLVAMYLLVCDPAGDSVGAACFGGAGYLFYWVADRLDPFS